MAAAFKSRFQSGLSEPDLPQVQNHRTHYCSGYSCIKTNGSLVHSFSDEEREMSALNDGSKFDQDIDDPSSPLKDVEALISGYSHSHFGKDEDRQREDENDDDFTEDGYSPILLSECPEFQACLQLFQAPNTYNVNDDEITFEYKSDQNGNLSEGKKEDEDVLWEFIEAETEFLHLSDEDSVHHRASDAVQSPEENPVTETRPALTSRGGVAALMDCAATELCHLRDGVAMSRRNPPQDCSGSLEPFSTPQIPVVSPKISNEERHDKATSTTGALTNLLQIQLAQINKMSETVRIEFSNQLAHERALLELLELEYNRVKAEVKLTVKEKGFAPTDLLNQFHHLKERLEQQKTLIDDLEYQYLEDKTKYEEEKESLVTQLKLQEETPSYTSTEIDRLENGMATSHREKGSEDGYTYPSSILSSTMNAPPPLTSSPIYSDPPIDPSLHFNCSLTDIGNSNICHERLPLDNEAISNIKSEVQASLLEELRCAPISSARFVSAPKEDFGHFSTLDISAVSTARHQWSTPTSEEHKTSIQLNIKPVFHQQTDQNLDENYYIGRDDFHESPLTTSSLAGGSNLHGKSTSASSSLLPNGRDFQQSSCTCSSTDVFYAVPPLLPSLSESADHRQWKREDPISSRCTNDIQIRHRQRNSSVATRRCWQDDEARPLTRYLPVPDDILFDLRHHLEVTCGHILCSPLLMPHLHVDATTCAGYLYKVESRVTSKMSSDIREASKNPIGDKSTPSVGGEMTTSSFFSPSTKRARKRSSRVTSPVGSGGFMATLFQRNRRGKRRWFVLDRRRRLLIYYSCHTSKSANAESLLKPKDVISFNDIIDVYPDQQGRKSNTNQNSNFCLLLVASCPPPPAMAPPLCPPVPTRTRTLSLTAPSPEAMRVWVDALFTCAGAYLCLLNVTSTAQRFSKPDNSANS